MKITKTVVEITPEELYQLYSLPMTPTTKKIIRKIESVAESGLETITSEDAKVFNGHIKQDNGHIKF